MCFSASASFTVSAILLVGGVIAIKKVKHISQLPFASLPLLFSIQQFTEGFVWLSIIDPNYLEYQHTSTFVFLFFAQVVWPILVPFSILLLEKNLFRKKIMYALFVVSVMLTIFLAHRLFTVPAYSIAHDYHIQYYFDFDSPTFAYSGVFYFIVTVIPALISSIRNMFFFGLAILSSFITSMLLFEDHIISVWCFFAAVISLLIIKIIADLKTPKIKTADIV